MQSLDEEQILGCERFDLKDLPIKPFRLKSFNKVNVC